MNYDLIRDGYGFRDTFDAGLDMATCQCDIEGVDIYDFDKDEYLGHVDWTTTSDIDEMTDEQFYTFLDDNDIYLI